MKKIFLIFYETFYSKNISYELFEPRVLSVERINLLIKENGLTGELINSDTFSLKDEGERYPALLKVIISEVATDRVKLYVTLRPHWVYLLFLVFLVISGIYNFSNLIWNTHEDSAIKLASIYLTGLVILMFMAKINLRRIRNKFEKYLKVTPMMK